MATRETRADRGRRRGRQVGARLLGEIRGARLAANVSQRSVALALGWSHARYGRFENDRLRHLAIEDVAAVAALFGLDLGAGLHPVGDPIRDAGHQALIGRFRAEVSPAIQVTAEVPLPSVGDRRSWDLLLRFGEILVGVELETRIRDVQWFVRRIRERERDGGVDHILIVLSDSSVNRRLAAQLMEALGPRFATAPRLLLRALRSGQALPGSGVVRY